ncbi:MAG: nuclear transport factor 2 family protein [Sphingomonas sp.]|nr:nuclear transport factor 2 family protein [Sphingomonas sp.]
MIDPRPFAERWLAAWNAHDLDAVLALFHDDVVFTSPLAMKVVPESAGVIRGKPALRAYWSAALAQVPDLHFELTSLFAGVDSLLIGFSMNNGPERFEIVRFRDDRVSEGHGTYRVET